MDEMLETLAQHVGISPETARNGVGAVVTFLKEHLSGDLFGHVEKAIPDAPDLASSFEANKSGGIVSTVAGLAGKLLGGKLGEASKLAGLLSQAGLSVSQVESFLPKLLEMLRSVLPIGVIEQISAAIFGHAGEAKGS